MKSPLTANAHARRISSRVPEGGGVRTRNEWISVGSTTKSYEKTSYEVSSSVAGGKCSTVSGRQDGMTIDFHFIRYLCNGTGEICCHLRAREYWA